MEELPSIPDAEIDVDFDFIKKLTTVAVSILFVVFGYYTWQIISGDLSWNGPSNLVLEQEEDFKSLIQYDEVDNFSGSGVDVCIVDSGIAATHRDLEEMNLADWSDFIGSSTEPYDDNDHGTMMAGILVADGGLSGIAMDVNLYVAKALAANGSGDDATVAQAIDWCISKDVDIISLSLGGATSGASVIFGDDVESAVDSAYDQGIVVVAAAGNDGSNDDGDVASPGTVDTVICVGGVDANGNLWSGSSIGDNDGRIWPILLPRNSPNEKPEVVAPAESVPVIIPGDSWIMASGTSAATVFVTGAIAILFEAYPELMDGGTDMLDNLKQWIVDSSKTSDGQDGHDDHYGYGLLQINGLLEASQA